jgi:hypothetical protein
MSDEQGRDGEGGAPPKQAHDPVNQEAERPGEVFKKGLSLLWKAARSAADEIKHEVEKGGVTDALKQAGRDLEDAANQAAKALEGFVERAGGHKPNYTDQWPPPGGSPPEASAQPPQPEGAAPAAPDGGLDENGERRDVRIQIEDDDAQKPR